MLKIKGVNFIETSEGMKLFLEDTKEGFKALYEAMQENLKKSDTDFEKFQIMMDFAERTYFFANLCTFTLTDAPLQEKPINKEDLQKAIAIINKEISAMAEQKY